MRETTISIEGNPYRVTGINARQSEEFLDYAKKLLPDPVAELLATVNQLPDGKIKDAFLEKHLDRAFDAKKLRGSLSDPDVEAFVKTPEGFKKLFSLMFKKYHPNLTESEVYDLVVKGIEEHGETIFLDLYTNSQKVPVAEEDAERKYFRGNRASTRRK